VDEGLSVREAEQTAAGMNRGKKPPAGGSRRRSQQGRKEPEIREIEERLIERLGTKIEIRGTKDKGRIEISYFSAEDLQRVTDLLKGEG
jgi:ParB family chromosome partitioning protein